MRQLVRFDWAMKRLLRSKANFGILEGFLSELLKRDLKILSLLESESNKEDKDGKLNRVDILAELTTGERVLIEVQVNSETDYFYRMLFGTSKIVTEYLGEGEPYSQIKKVYSINILYFDLGHGSDYIYHGTTSFVGMHNNDTLALTEKQKGVFKKDNVYEIYPEYYLIKLNQFNEIAKDTLDEWIYFLKTEEIKDTFRAKGLIEAKEKLDSLKLDPKEKEEYKKYTDNLSYQKSMVISNYEDGRVTGKLEVAKNLKKLGINNETIQQATGMSADEIDKL
jgi:predicted transposase/invertase (TIGR01784 family)